jgi:hypothetical protein
MEWNILPLRITDLWATRVNSLHILDPVNFVRVIKLCYTSAVFTAFNYEVLNQTKNSRLFKQRNKLALRCYTLY